MRDKLIPPETGKYLRERFKALDKNVDFILFTKKGANNAYNELTRKFVAELVEINSKIRVRMYDIPSEHSSKYGVVRSPTVLIQPDLYNIRYTGAPAGEEGRSFIETIVRVSKRVSDLSQKSREILKKLRDDWHIMVFVTPSCPYCPGQVVHAFAAAIERPELIKAEMVECMENPDLCQEYNVGAVPHTVVNGITLAIGLHHEGFFIMQLLTLQPSEEVVEGVEEEAGGVVAEYDLIIVGGGHAGLAAEIYGGRVGLRTVVVEKGTAGGLVALTPTIENYPRLARVGGGALVEMMVNHARNYADIRENEEVVEVKLGRFVEAITSRGTYRGRGIIIATGAEHRKLGIEGENYYYGRGVSYCATCDGNLYSRDAFRAEKYLQDRIGERGIPVLWNTVVERIAGDGRGVRTVHLRDVKKKERIET